MAGTESRQMIKTDIEEPTGLAIDFTGISLYLLFCNYKM